MEIVATIISALLIILWLYTVYSKLSDIEKYRTGMQLQTIPGWSKNIITWLLPPVELCAAILLAFSGSRLAGMYLSFLLMLLFTVYVTGAVLQLYNRYPCTCGGLFRKIGWKKHLIVNVVFTIIALAGILLIKYNG